MFLCSYTFYPHHSLHIYFLYPFLTLIFSTTHASFSLLFFIPLFIPLSHTYFLYHTCFFLTLIFLPLQIRPTLKILGSTQSPTLGSPDSDSDVLGFLDYTPEPLNDRCDGEAVLRGMRGIFSCQCY